MQRIEAFFLPGPAGRLECSLKLPAEPATAQGVAVVCHPHPLFGGNMQNRVVHAAARALGAAGLPVLRFNFRGVGGSGGAHDGGRGECADLGIVLDHLAGRFTGRPLLAAGYSFGAAVALRVGAADPRVAALIGIGVPIGLFDFGFLRFCRKPLALIQGEADPLGPLDRLLTLAAALPGGARVMAVKGAGHGFTDHLEEFALRVRQAIPEELAGPGGVTAPP